MAQLGFGKIKLIEKIINYNWGVLPNQRKYTFNELLFVIQEMIDEEGKSYFEEKSIRRGHHIFREFTKYLIYRNLANYDSMLLLTSEKGCLTDDTLIEMPRDLIKYPKGIPIKELIDKKDFYVYSFNIKKNMLEVKKAKSCEFAKEADIYELELTNGMKIKCTDDHPFLLTNGEYKQLKDLYWIKNDKKEKSREFKNGKLCYTDRLRIFSRPYKLVNDNFIKINFNKIDRKNNDTSYQHSMMEHRFIIEQIYNKKLSMNDYVHHKDNNHFNNNVDNLILSNSKEHRIIHNMNKYDFKEGNKFTYLKQNWSTKKKEKIKKGTQEYNNKCKINRITYFTLKENINKCCDSAKEREKNNVNSNHILHGGIIKSIKFLGKQKTYDIVGVEDNKNFIANGFVVSNTGKSSAAIMIAKEWCRQLGIRFDPNRHIAYNNGDVMNKIELLNKFEPIIADEAVRFATSEDWAKKENKELKKKLAQVRTKHLLYILCFPLKVKKLEKTYLESFVNYWIDLYGRGVGAIYVKDKNPVHDAWRLDDFKNIGSYTEFNATSYVEKILKRHPNFWNVIKFPKPPKWLYDKYLRIREKNIYDDENILKNVSKEDIHRALLILSLRDIMMHDTSLNINRIILHIKNTYDISINKNLVESAIEDSRQLITKVREQGINTFE